MGRMIDVDILLKDLAKFEIAHQGDVTYDDARNYIACMSQQRPAHKSPYESAISQIKNYKQGVIDIVGDCGFARGLQKALDILEEGTHG